jgi:predicted ABC-type ATPase
VAAGMQTQLWVVAGGNGAGKSTFYRLFLAPRGIKLVNADLLAREINAAHPDEVSYQAANWVGRLLADLLDEGLSFCFETVFSHPSKIDLVARAKAGGYRVMLVYIHLDNPGLNEARVRQRVSEGGHNVPADKVRSRIPRTMQYVSDVLTLVDEAWLMNNSSHDGPFRLVAVVRKGRLVRAGGGALQADAAEPMPEWARQMLGI